MRYRNNVSVWLRIRVRFRFNVQAVYGSLCRNAVDVELTDDDNDDNSSLSPDLFLLLAIKLYPSQMNECLNECLNK